MLCSTAALSNPQTPRAELPPLPLTRRGLAVVLPAYNEEAVIGETVPQCVAMLSALTPDFEGIVVDDGSRDRTGANLCMIAHALRQLLRLRYWRPDSLAAFNERNAIYPSTESGNAHSRSDQPPQSPATTMGGRGFRGLIRRELSTLRADWNGPKFYPAALLLAIVVSAVAAIYYLNHPALNIYSGTQTYVQVADRILTKGLPVDPQRVPGYPMLIALVFSVFGYGNLDAVSIAQVVLFVLVSVEIYALAFIVSQRTWVAFVAGLVVGSNVYLLAAAKPILSEGVTIFVTVSLTLAVVLCLRSLRALEFWIVALFTCAAFLTRAEWVYLPVPLFAYLLFVAARRGLFLRLLPHAAVATLLLYAIVYVYSSANQANFGYSGLSDTQGVNLLGKIMQYQMQNEAPPQYADVSRTVDDYVARGVHDPEIVLNNEPALKAHHYALATDYSIAIIKAHPVQFVADTGTFTLVALPQTSDYYSNALLTHDGPFASILFPLASLSAFEFRSFQLLPMLAAIWFGFLLWRRSSREPAVEFMAAISLVVVYEIVVVMFGGFSYANTTRVQSAVDPLLLLLVWISAVDAWPVAVAALARTSAVLRPLSYQAPASETQDDPGFARWLEDEEDRAPAKQPPQWRDALLRRGLLDTRKGNS